MSNELQNNQEKNVNYKIGENEIKLSPSIVAQYITKGNGEISMTEAVNFMQFCKHAGLNPFLDEAYLIKYSNDAPAQTVTSKAAFMKRAHRQPQFNGLEAGIIVRNKDGNTVSKSGQFIDENERLLGGWAIVHRKDLDYPFEIQVGLKEYNTGKSMWNKMPANMIRKVALSAALREAFPEALSAMYTEDEPNITELENSVKTAEKTESNKQNILSDFKKENEETDQKEKEETVVIETNDEPKNEPETVDEPEVVTEQEYQEMQSELFDGITTNPKEEKEDE